MAIEVSAGLPLTTVADASVPTARTAVGTLLTVAAEHT
jgi:hypothetical protein